MYKDADKFPPKQLNVSRGSIFYNAVSHYGPKNLATNVREMSQMPLLTTNFLSQFGVELSDIEKNADVAGDWRRHGRRLGIAAYGVVLAQLLLQFRFQLTSGSDR